MAWKPTKLRICLPQPSRRPRSTATPTRSNSDGPARHGLKSPPSRVPSGTTDAQGSTRVIRFSTPTTHWLSDNPTSVGPCSREVSAARWLRKALHFFSPGSDLDMLRERLLLPPIGPPTG